MIKTNRLLAHKLIMCFFLYQITLPIYANTYYVSSSGGNDSYSLTDAQQQNTPWKSISKINSISANFKAGDFILFKKGDLFIGTLQINASGNAGNPIIVGAYGDGQLPEITGFSVLLNWQQKGNNIWESTVNGGLSYMNSVLINGVPKAVGRYPNASATEQGYLHFDSFNSNTSITDNKIASQPDWSGGQIVIRKNRWVLDRNNITTQSGTTINYSSQSGYSPSQGYAYFIQNHPSTLDVDGEWYYQANGNKLGIYSSSTNPNNATIQASIVETLVLLSNQSNLTFQNIRFSGAAANAFDISNCQNIDVSNCEIVYAGKNAVTAANSTNITIENTLFNYTGNIALLINNCSTTVLNNNKIHNTGVIAGMGEGDSGSYESVLISGDNNVIQNNIIDSTGYIPLTFSGNNTQIKNNTISNFAMIKDDGGGIYTWNNGTNPPTNYGRIISGNIVLNGIGAPSGTDDLNTSYAHGIYIDDNAGQVDILNNTVANCASNGIYIHNAHDLNIKQNTAYNNAVQLLMEHDAVAANSPIYNTTVTGNILFAKMASQLAAAYKTKDNDIANFGSFDANYYYRPIDNDLVIGVLQQVNGVYSYNTLSVDSWKALYGKDANAVKSTHQIAPYKVTNVSGSNQFTNGTFDNNIGGLYAYASANNCNTSWSNGILDGGALQISFSSTTSSANYGSVIIGIGAVTAGTTYRLKFSMLGSNVYKAITAYLRQSAGSYADLSERKTATITGSRLEKEFLFTATASENNASVVFDVPEQSSPVNLDNIQLNKVDATITNPDNFIYFFFNSFSGDFSYNTPALSYDATGKSYQNSITLNPFTSLVLMVDSSSTIAAQTTDSCAATGYILREEWDNVSGNNVSDIPLTTPVTSSSQITSFEGPVNIADNYASRIRGYICPPQNGNYTFWIAADDAAELWLSTDDNPGNKVRIANLLSWTGYREWDKYSSQQSSLITLQAGKKYYIEALHKEGNGGDNLSVQWQLPSGTIETPIAGSHLSPFIPLQNQTINFPAITEKTVGSAPFPVNVTASSGLAVSLQITAGPATIAGNVITITGTGLVSVEASQAGNNLYSAATAIVQQFSVYDSSAIANCSATGTILREEWDNVAGNNVSDIPLQTAATSTSQLTALEGPVNIADNYASRIRGYICPPQTGAYNFWIAADDAAELWLSSNDDPTNKVLIANLLSWTDYRQWDKFTSQASASIILQAGKKYYVEALHKEGNGGDNLSVKWQLPDGTMQIPVPGTYLSPFILQTQSNSFTAAAIKSVVKNTDISSAVAEDVTSGVEVFPNPVIDGQANINVIISKLTEININLYNADGRLIRKIFSGTLSPKLKTTINFDSRFLTSGLYFVILTGEQINFTKKIDIISH